MVIYKKYICECDQVADVKKNIETVLGVTAYPAAEQRLIHKGKVLKDETTVEANNVSEKSTIGVMKVCAKGLVNMVMKFYGLEFI